MNKPKRKKKTEFKIKHRPLWTNMENGVTLNEIVREWNVKMSAKENQLKNATISISCGRG